MIPKSRKTKKYTYADYLTWPDGERWELIDGEIYDMSPAPSDEHQRISWELSRQIANFLSDGKCQGRSAPYDVIFPEGVKADDKIVDVVQPDIVVICDESKIDRRGCRGAPDFIIEIVSSSTASRDHITKQALYEKNGVGEYWIVDPVYKLITRRILGENNAYGPPMIHEGKGEVEAAVLPGLRIDFDAVFGALSE